MSPQRRTADREPVTPRSRVQTGDEQLARLGLRLERHGPETVVVTVVGEIDLCTMPRLREFLRQRLASCLRTVVLDVGGVTFIDSAGLELLGGCQQRADENDVRLHLVYGIGSPVGRLLWLMDMEHRFPYAATAEEALAERGGSLTI